MSQAFHGQQEGETVFYTAIPHPVFFLTRIIFLALVCLALFLLNLQILKNVTEFNDSALMSYLHQNLLYGALFQKIFFILGVIWIYICWKNTKLFITDRRIIRFEAHTPFLPESARFFGRKSLNVNHFRLHGFIAC